jgi:hypothetical protein
MKTIENKIVGSILILIGAASMMLENDATAFVLLAIFAIILMFSKENIIS